MALLVGAFAGLLIASASGARRISSAYGRFFAATRAADVVVAASCPQPAVDGPCTREVDPARLAALPPVDDLALGYSWNVPVTTIDHRLLNPQGDSCFSASGELDVLGSRDSRLGTELNATLLVSGRRARRDRADEVVLTFATAQRAGVHVGDELLLYLHATDCQFEKLWGMPTRVRVVGIGQMAGEVPASHQFRVEGVHVTPVLAGDLLRDPSLETPAPLAFIRLAPHASVSDFLDAANAAEMPVTEVAIGDDLRDGVKERLAPDSTMLWLVAAMGAAAAIIVLGSAVAYAGATAAADVPALHTLGWGPREFAAWGSAEGGAIGAVAASFAVVVAAAASSIVRIGESRHFDPARGFRLDSWTIAIGAAITMVVVTSAFAIGRRGAIRNVLRPSNRPVRARWSDALLARVPGLPVTAFAGIRFASAPRTRGSVPLRRGTIGLTLGIFGVVGALTFLAGVDRLVATPRLFGVNWTATRFLPEDPPAPDAIDESLRRLRQDPRVRAASVGTYFPPFESPTAITVGDARIQVYPMSFSIGPHAVRPTVIHGRAPEGPDDIILNPLLAERLHSAIGDEVDVRVASSDGTTTYPFELVGTGVLPVGDGRPEVGSAVTLEGLRRLDPGAQAQMFLLDLRDNATADSVLDDLGIVATTDSLDSSSVGVEQLVDINVARLRQAPMALAIILGLMAAAVLAYVCASAVRARTNDIAVTRALGFESRQVRRSMACMLTFLGGAGVMIALPLGIAAGRVAYGVFAERLGVLPEPAVPWWHLAGLVPALLCAAYLVSLWPGRRASNVATATVLRPE